MNRREFKLQLAVVSIIGSIFLVMGIQLAATHTEDSSAVTLGLILVLMGFMVMMLRPEAPKSE